MHRGLTTILMILFTSLSLAQYDMEEAKKEEEESKKEPEKTPYEIKKKIYVGGDLSLQFGASTYLYIGPMAGYDLYKGLSAGLSGMYQFSRFSNSSGFSQSYHSYGGGIFARYRPPALRALLLHIELDAYNTSDFTTAYQGDRVTVPAALAGIGYAGGSQKFYYQIMLMYDFVDDINNPLPRLFSDIPIYLRYGIVFYLEQ